MAEKPITTVDQLRAYWSTSRTSTQAQLKKPNGEIVGICIVLSRSGTDMVIQPPGGGRDTIELSSFFAKGGYAVMVPKTTDE